MRSIISVLCVTAATCVGCAGAVEMPPGLAFACGGEAVFCCGRDVHRRGTVDGRRVGRHQVRPQRRDHRHPRRPGRVGQRECSAGRLLHSGLLRRQQHAADDIVGAEDYCHNGPDCDTVPAEMPVPAEANVEGSSDLSCDPSGNTDGQGDCHLLVVDRDGRKLYETSRPTRPVTPSPSTGSSYGTWTKPIRTICAATSARAPTPRVSRSPR